MLALVSCHPASRKKLTDYVNPMLGTATLWEAEDKTLTIRTHGGGSGRYYVQSAKFNGKLLDRCWLYRDEIYQGGTLDLVLSDQPSDCWDASVPPVSR